MASSLLFSMKSIIYCSFYGSRTVSGLTRATVKGRLTCLESKRT